MSSSLFDGERFLLCAKAVIMLYCLHHGSFAISVKKTFHIRINMPSRYVFEIFQFCIFASPFANKAFCIFVAFNTTNTR